jgi:DNA-directed RNA polymerase subunit L
MEEVRLPDQNNTLGSILRELLMGNGASFASCIVPHPLDNELTVRLACATGTPKECLLASLREASAQVQSCLDTVNAHLVHEEMAQD